ncbi:MAG: beta-galactosidase [Oryzihumus sp.]
MSDEVRRTTTAPTDWSALRGGAARLGLGCDYNPEQWPREVWREDVRLMQEAGLTFVTLGVFSWSLLEPEPGRHDFGWLDEVVDLLAGAGIRIDMATATASPPPWLSAMHPETLPVDREGRRLWPGGRQAWCPSSTVFRDRAVALTAAMAEHYGNHEALALWHVSNEYGCHNVPCYCDTCAAGFRRWLEQRYEDVATLNDAWGTAFWSQRYTSFEQVLPPRLAPTPSNPTQVLDYARFSSDALLDQFLAEKQVLREVTPHVPVTTNFMTLSHFRHLDYTRWAPHQDVVSTDHYLVATQPEAEAELAFSGDLTRGLAGGRPWLLMEHSTGAVNWQPVNPAKPRGQLLRNAVEHVAHGADGIGFFQWRASKAGTEKYHSGLVPHAGTDSRLWRDVVHLGEVVGRLGEVAGSRVEARAALLWDYESGWATDQPSHPSELVRYGEDAHAVHAALLHRGVAADVVHPGTDLSGYPLIVVPTVYLWRDEWTGPLQRAVEAGARVLVTFYSGMVDKNDHVRLGGYPGALRSLLGLRTEEMWPLLPGETSTLDNGWTGSVWAEQLRLEGAESHASHTAGDLAGVPAVTRHAVGAGAAWYLATRLGQADLDGLLTQVLSDAGVEAPVEAPPGVEQVRRVGDSASYLFLINHGDGPVSVPVTGHDLVSATDVDGRLELAAGGVAVIREGS